MDDVVSADKVSVVRPIDLPSGTYSPDAVVTIDSGNRNEPLKKLPLGELMPKTDGVSVFRAYGTSRLDDGEFSIDSVEVVQGEDIRCVDDAVVVDKGSYHLAATFVVWLDEDPVDEVIVPALYATLGNNSRALTYTGTTFDMSMPGNVVALTLVCDFVVDTDDTILHLRLEGMPESGEVGEDVARVALDQLSIHKIAAVLGESGGGSAEGGGDAAVFDLMDYADDMESDTLWLDMVNAMLDGKAVALKAPFETDSVEAIGWAERSMRLKPGYTKEEYIEDILGELDESLLALTFDITLSLYGGMAKVIETIRVTPNGVTPDCMAILMAGYGAIVQGGRDGFACESIMPFNEAGDDFDLSRYGEVLARLALKGIPITFFGYNITEECMFNMATVDKIGYPAEPSDKNHTVGFTMEMHGIAMWDGEDVHYGDRFPCMYSVGYGFLPPEEDAEIDVHGKWEIESDNVRPLAIDSTYMPNER